MHEQELPGYMTVYWFFPDLISLSTKRVPLSSPAAADAVVNQLVWKIYDYFLTASAEVNHIWNRSPAIVTFLYYVSRYTPFLDTAVVVIYRGYFCSIERLHRSDGFLGTFVSNPSLEVCYAWMSAECYAAVLGMGASECNRVFVQDVGSLGTKTVNRNITLPDIFNVRGGDVWYSAICEIINLVSIQVLTGIDVGGCILYSTSKAQLISWGCLLFADFSLLALMVIKMWHDYRHIPQMPGIARIILGYGLSVANLVVAGQDTPGRAETLMMVNIPTRCLHSIFASRMFLHIREAGSNSIIAGEEAITLQTLKTIVFAPAAARQGPDEFDMTTLPPTQDVGSLTIGEREDA
ncbi:hypothetical protein BU15DRAFT_61382 [Melanogaster broomeanus]|nr:hypothetical protein BU15DRAFT_61382 [Melanogaster broomeanus]